MEIQSITILVGVLLLFPIAVVLLGELSLRLELAGKKYANSVNVIRNVLLPLMAIYLLATNLGGYESDSTINKVFLTAGVIIGLGGLVGIINGVLFDRDTDNKVPKLFLDLGRILVIALGIALTLSLVWGLDLSQLITALGVSSIVLGLALQDTLGNLFNGITLINERPFKVGDYIEVDGHDGRVVEVNWRAVRLLTRERDLIVLPHLKVAQSAIMNHSQPEEHWAQKVMLGFSYDHPPNFVKRIMLETCAATPGILTHPPAEAKVDDFADSAVVYEVEYYIANYGQAEDVKNDFMTRVWYAAQRHDISIPFPQVNYHREPQADKEARRKLQREADLSYAVRMLNIPGDTEKIGRQDGVVIRSYGEGEPLINYGRTQGGLFFVLSGVVQLKTKDATDALKLISELQRGDFITQLLLPGSRKNAIAAVALEDSRVVYFPESVTRRLVNRYPKLAIQTEDILATRRKQVQKIKGESRRSVLRNGRR